jgi:hypothetical protein
MKGKKRGIKGDRANTQVFFPSIRSGYVFDPVQETYRHDYILVKLNLFVLSSESNQLEIINQSVLRMFIIALQLCFVYEPYEGLFSVVSVLAFTLPTPGRGAVAVIKDHKKISYLMEPYNTDSGNQVF